MAYRAISEANRAVYNLFRGAGGTTLTALMLRDGENPCVAHVGDSRLYMKGDSGELELITKDDTVFGQMGSGSNEDMLDNRLLQFVGIGRDLEPHIFSLSSYAGHEFILTTDGAHSIGKRALNGIVSNATSSLDIVRKILYVAEAIGTDDNASAIAISTHNPEYLPQFGTGLEARISTPSDKIEIWLYGDVSRNSAIANITSESSASNEQPLAKPVGKKTRSGRTSQKPRKFQTKPISNPQNKKPQLHIEFNDEGNDEG
ncbi:hypothetical protein GGQ76_004403 [Aureimonas jatrophae]|nr:hypothetical protein [Aureimonas jatrophae]